MVFAHAYGIGYCVDWSRTKIDACYNKGYIYCEGREIARRNYDFEYKYWGTDYIAFSVKIEVPLYQGPTVNYCVTNGELPAYKSSNTYYTNNVSKNASGTIWRDGKVVKEMSFLETSGADEYTKVVSKAGADINFVFRKRAGVYGENVSAYVSLKTYNEIQFSNCGTKYTLGHYYLDGDLHGCWLNNSAGEYCANSSTISNKLGNLTGWDVSNNYVSPNPYLKDFYW